jgi:hypothetical protein
MTGQGPGNISFEALPNRSLQARTADVVVSGQRVTLSQSAATCSIAVTPTTLAVGPEATEARLHIAAEDFCSWSASSQLSWLTFGSASNGTGSFELVVNIAPNSGSQRAGTINVAGTQVNVSQREAAPACQISLSPASGSTAASGGSLTIEVTAASACTWSVSTSESWITSKPSGGTGSGTIVVNIAPNTGNARTGVLTIGGKSFTVTQTAASSPEPSPPPTPAPSPQCTFSLGATSQTVGAAAGSYEVTVTAPANCSWSASTNASWIQIVSGASGTGAGSVMLAYEANSGPARSASVTIAGTTFTLSQQAGSLPAVCTFTVQPLRFDDVTATASTLDVNITTAAQCLWSASSNATWITVASGNSGTGNGVVRLSILQNSGNSRSGTVTVAGQTVTVNQVGAATCSYKIDPVSLANVQAAGASAPVTVTTTAGCAWEVKGNPSWVTATPVSSTGSGTVLVTVQPNTGSARTTTFKIAGENFSVAQLAAAPVCTYTVSPNSIDVSSDSHTQTITVTTQANCPVAATVDVEWISITSVGVGPNAIVSLSIQRNASKSDRTGTVTITGQNFSRAVQIRQRGRD